MKLLIASILSLPLMAQTVSMDSVVGKPGEPASIPVNVSIGTLAGIQWTMEFPNGFTEVFLSTQRSDKQIFCKSGNKSCIMLGVSPPNSTAIPKGEFLSLVVGIPKNTAPGKYAVTVKDVKGVSSTGTGISLTGSTATITIPAPSIYDLTEDGKVDQSDLAKALELWLNDKPCPTLGDSPACSADNVFSVWAELLKQSLVAVLKTVK